MKKTTSFIVLLALMMSAFATVSADDHSDDDNSERGERYQQFKAERSEVKSKRDVRINGNKDAAKQNRKDFRGENKEVFQSLDEDTKAELKQLGEDFKAEMKALKDKFKTSDDREGLLEEMKALSQSHHDKVEVVLADNPEALAVLAERKEVFEKNAELRQDSAEARKQFRGERWDLIVKYKSAFVKRIGNKLDKISEDKLERLLSKIGQLIEKYENNDKLSDDRKDKVISQLVALQEMIEEKLEDEDDEDILDIEEILEIDDEEDEDDEDDDED